MDKKREGKEGKILTMPGVIFNSYKILKTLTVSQRFSSAIVEHIQRGEPLCIHCASKALIHYDTYWRKIKHIANNGALYILIVKCKRYKCKDCGKIFREELTGIRPYKRISESYRNVLVHEYAKNVSNKTIAEEYNVSQSTVERAIHQRYDGKLKEALSYECPSVIGIDEHTIRKGYKFATTIADLSHHRVYDVIYGKAHKLIEEKLMRYKGRENVKVVCMDLSSGYRSIVRRCFPNAKILADRFHVIRLVLYHFMEFCKAAQEELKWNRKLTYPLRKRGDRLKSHDRERLFFKENTAIKLAYEFKERLCELLNRKSQTARQSKANIKQLKEMMKTMRYEATIEFETLANTISEWFEPIIRMWRYTRNNGITERFHRKMKLIQRRAYGYRNFENYRLRVLVECGVKL